MDIGSYIWTLLWILWQIFNIIWLTMPFMILAWPSTIIAFVRAHGEYKKFGGGPIAFLRATWFAIKTMPSTVVWVIRFTAGSIVLGFHLYGIDITRKMPERLRDWLNLSGMPTRVEIREKVVEKIVDRPVEKIKWKRPPLMRRVIKSIVLIGFGYILGQWTNIGPWVYWLASFLHS